MHTRVTHYRPEMWIGTEVENYQSAIDWNVYPLASGSLLGNGSQLITSTVGVMVDTDFNGTPRNLTHPTIGAYEFTSAGMNLNWKLALGKRGSLKIWCVFFFFFFFLCKCMYARVHV